MQALRKRGSFGVLLLAGGVALLAAGASQAQDAGDARAQAAAETSATSGDDTARRNDQSCLNRFGRDFVRAFNQGPNAEPVDADSVNLTLTPRAEPVDVPC